MEKNYSNIWLQNDCFLLNFVTGLIFLHSPDSFTNPTTNYVVDEKIKPKQYQHEKMNLIQKRNNTKPKKIKLYNQHKYNR